MSLIFISINSLIERFHLLITHVQSLPLIGVYMLDVDGALDTGSRGARVVQYRSFRCKRCDSSLIVLVRD